MAVKQGLDLDRVVLLGRTLAEYQRYFALQVEDLRARRILDVAAGVSSFTAEASELGARGTAFDPIYKLSAQEIGDRCQADLEHVVKAIANLQVYRWEFYRDPAGMREYRLRAYQKFLADFGSGVGGRYVAGELPQTPFRNGQFELVLVSYFLFVYEARLTYELHQASVRELMRITSGEIRIYPLVTFEAERSQYLDRLQREPEFSAWEFVIVPTDFEFLRNSNCYLRIARRSKAAERLG
jgi:hypothetical protein